MRKATAMKDLLHPADLDARGMRHVLRLAAAMKAAPAEWSGSLASQTVACVFPRLPAAGDASFEAAVHRLGALPLRIPPDRAPSPGEPIADTARVLSGYCAAIAVRTVEQTAAEAYAAASSIPVINALTDLHHPCQALADLLTLRERFGRLDGLRLAYVGRGGGVANSLIEACAINGIGVSVATPQGAEPDPGVVARARAVAARFGEQVELVSDPREAVAGADAVYTAAWSDAETGDRTPFRVDRALMRTASPTAVFLHALPARRGDEVTAEVLDGPRSLAIQQAHNRLPVEQAVLHTLITGDWDS
ncbi:MAG TPA: ornithine carbamoyltransferase [Solirubrobacteraceae bacterium]